jgi:cell division transport system ATP-binding protein
MDGKQPCIQLHRVSVVFSDEVAGLRDVSLRIERGEFIYLCGQTGSGKSTLLKVLTREVAHTSGKALIDGRDLAEVKPTDVHLLRREMGIVPQDFALLPNRRVWENVGYALRAIGKTRKEVRHRVPEILEQVNILHRADAYPAELSGGEQQRVAIGRAMISSPPLLIADEPTANLDLEHSMGIMELLRNLNAKGTTVIVATHDMPIVERFPARVIKMEFGRVYRPDDEERGDA